jgi:ABC-type polysaccharide transport system permease subunit
MEKKQKTKNKSKRQKAKNKKKHMQKLVSCFLDFFALYFFLFLLFFIFCFFSFGFVFSFFSSPFCGLKFFVLLVRYHLAGSRLAELPYVCTFFIRFIFVMPDDDLRKGSKHVVFLYF